MPTERNLPENVTRRLEKQHFQAQQQLAKYTNALWHVRAAISELSGAQPLFATDDATLQQLRVSAKCLEADQCSATRYEQSAFRLYCEHEGIDPKEEEGHDEMGELHKAGLSRGRA